ncbi:DegV family protein [Pseudalkalibacillus caeni]|uniref:DegV family protein n=1 Tax=Exobacillus caeni TaxID=2574798 RepID=A0A5R9EWL7_9BACL|nr:DegV family protein [Pseudalkalibacillus caeni]TLS35049.1 DegV family protein [Pseudalkalibacillus caeni]
MANKEKIAWVTDSTCSLDREFIKENNIFVIPLYILFGQKSYKEEIDLTAEEFYIKLTESKDLPTTSQPALGEFVELYNNIKENYSKVIAIHASSALTGTYQGSVTAADMSDIEVKVIDSKVGSYPLGRMVREGIRLQQEGRSYDEITAYLDSLPDKAQLYLVPGSLQQLNKGGRVSGSQALIANLIKLKVIIKFENGKAIMSEKIRTAKKLKKRLFDIFEEASNGVTEASVLHANDEERAERWKQELESLYPDIRFVTTMLSPIAGAHTGQGTMGLSWIKS